MVVAGATMAVGGLVVTAPPAQAAGPVDLTYLGYAVPDCTGAALANLGNPTKALGYLVIMATGKASPFGGCYSGLPI